MHSTYVCAGVQGSRDASANKGEKTCTICVKAAAVGGGGCASAWHIRVCVHVIVAAVVRECTCVWNDEGLKSVS